MLVRIIKQYNHRSPKNGIIETDSIDFKGIEEAARFVTGVNANKKLDYDIIDYSRVLIGGGSKEIITNPTGGYTGKLIEVSNG